MSQSLPQPPAATHIERDEDGRLTALHIEAAGTAAPCAEHAWLVAVDGSAHALNAVSEAIRLAQAMKSCALHLINVQPWLSREAAEHELATKAWAATATARELLEQAGLGWHLHVAMGEAAERILAEAERLHCAGIVTGSRGLGATQGMLLGSVAYKLMHMSHLPVLLVR
jgi:nucleotide-binding universal stress UspA family protein